jgi:hypothetical protein
MAEFDVNKSYGTPEKLLENLKMVESSGNPNAINKESGAMGHYQFIPSTVEALKKEGVEFDPFDPKESKAAADYYIQKLAKKHGGDYEKAMADYGGFKTKDPSHYVGKVLKGISPIQEAQASESPEQEKKIEAASFDPDAYLAKVQEQTKFDPDAYLKSVTKPTAEETSALSTAVHGAERGTLPLVAALAGGEYGAGLGTAILPGAGTVIGGIVGGLAGGFGASAIVSAAQEKFLKANPKIAEVLGQDEATREKEEAAHPNIAFASELAPSVLAFRPSGTLLKSAEGLTKKGAELLKAQKTAALVNSGINSAVMGGMEAGQEAMGEGPMDPAKIAIAAATGALGQKETALGRGITKLGQIPMTEAMRTRVEAMRRPEGEPEVIKETPEKETGKTSASPITGALDASHFNEEDIASVKTPQQKLDEEINRVAEGKNPIPTQDEVNAEAVKAEQAKKAAEELQTQQEAAMKVPKAETTIKPTDIVTEEGVKLNEPIDTTLINKKDVEKLGTESKKALEQNIAEQEAAKETQLKKEAREEKFKEPPTQTLSAKLVEEGGIAKDQKLDMLNETGKVEGYNHVFREKGNDLLTMVKDGKLDDYLPPEIRSTATPRDELFDARPGYNYISDLIKSGEKVHHYDYEIAKAQHENMVYEKNQAKQDIESLPPNEKARLLANEEQGKVFYSKGAIEGGVNKEHFYDRILREFGPSVRGLFKRGLVEVYNTLEEVPEHIRKHFDDNTRALSVVENGTRKAVVVANRIHAGEVREVILHEVGEHYGLRGMLGEDVYKQILNTVENLKTKDMLVKAAYDETFNTPYYRELYKTNKDEFLSEVIAKLGEKAPNHGLVKRIVQAVKTFLIKKGFIKNVTGEEIQDLVMHSLRTAMDKDLPQFNNKGEPLRSQRPENQAEAQRVKDKLDQMNAPKTEPHGSKTMDEHFRDTKDMMKEGFESFKGNSLKENVQKAGKAGSKFGTKARIALVDYTAGLQEADARRYGRSVTKANGEAISTVAATDAIHSNHILAQVMLKGKLIFNNITKSFQAVEDRFSMANVFKAEDALYKKLGKDTGARLIQTWGLAKRSRSIQNEFEMRHGKLLELKEGITDAESLAKNSPDVLAGKLHDLDVLSAEDYARMKQNPDTLAKRLMKIYDNARADAEKEFADIIKAYTSIPKEFCVLNSNGERHIQKVRTRGGKEVAEVPLINDDHIDAAIHEENAHPELRDIMENFTSVNHNMLDNMYHAGLLNEGRWRQLKSIKDYIPWYRVDDEAEPIHYTAPGGRALSGAKAEKKFTKGFVDKDVDNIITNMNSHIYTMGTNSIRNYAANEVVKDYATRDVNGKIKVFPKEEVTKDGAVRTNIVVNGQRVIIEIQDPLVAQAMLGVHQIDVPMMKALGSIQQLFRRSITSNPFFQVYQVFKDAPTAAAVTGLKNPFKVYAKIFGSFMKALRPDDEIVGILKSHGIGGFKLAGRTAEKEFNLQMGVQQHKFTSRMLSLLDHIGDASDYAQRRVIYEETLKQTGNPTQALYNANSIIDFMKRGNSKAAQFEVRTVAFMNAFGQQMDVLLQGMAGGGIKGMSRAEARNRFWLATGGFASMTLAYCMLKGNDPDYQKLDDDTKNRNFVFGKFKIPCSTSYSFLYKSAIENAYNYITSQGTETPMDATHLRQMMYKGFMEAGAGPNMIPTAIRPVIEIAFNHDTFTGGNVVPQSLAKLDPFLQYTNNTSELGKTMSHLTGGALNPIQMDHLMKGILGTAGSSMMWLSDVFTADKPEKVWSQNPFVGSFALPPEGHGPEALFYDLKEKTDAKYDTFMKLAMRQRGEDAQKYLKENQKLIAAHEYTQAMAPQLQMLTAEIQRMSDVPNTAMNAKKKRDLITEYQRIQNDMLKNVPKIRQGLAGL